MVPFLDLTREWNFFEAEFLRAFENFGRGGHYVLGPLAEKFEQDFAAFTGYKYAVGVSSGLAALEAALKAYGIGAGDEVITVPNSAVATALAVTNIGAKPVFCDVGEDFLIDPGEIEKYITDKTKAILPVHLFGKVCDMASINKIAKQHNLAVIEDSCQAHGAEFKGEGATNTKAFSFYPTKNLGALGEAGVVVTNDEKVKNFTASFRDYGQKGRYNHVILGNNYRIDALQCAFMEIKLRHLREFTGKRRGIAKKYIRALAKIAGLAILPFDETACYHLFVVRVLNGRRNELKLFLEHKGITALVHYPALIYRQPCYCGVYPHTSLAKAEALQEEILSLPCYPFLTEAEQDEVINNLQTFFNGPVA
ncbi:MAG: DegT/DnrJ/EryC1/StrS family aminotransferase [Patescibacteria group bacterium]|nr:DegT/DnrJ/EryC1/StrS family aminotransferase [Patescibacteria group bacterium]